MLLERIGQTLPDFEGMTETIHTARHCTIVGERDVIIVGHYLTDSPEDISLSHNRAVAGRVTCSVIPSKPGAV